MKEEVLAKTRARLTPIKPKKAAPSLPVGTWMVSLMLIDYRLI